MFGLLPPLVGLRAYEEKSYVEGVAGGGSVLFTHIESKAIGAFVKKLERFRMDWLVPGQTTPYRIL